jgi:exopolyphosphatase/guanosine-5'-triphosphate,3'-diphosphate pyrophosphatase
MLFRRNPKKANIYAAMDLGSNSFHMVVARVENGQLKIIDKLRESVRLAAALDDDNYFHEEAFERALDCLNRFSQRLRDVHSDFVRIVGTNTLRIANNSELFLKQAEEIVGHPIELISGFEEARLTYLGVAHGLAEDGKSRLLVDIGGSSTEFIIGENFEPKLLRSLQLGCVTFSKRFFESGIITDKTLLAAELFARIELEPIVPYFAQQNWEVAVGSSGTIRAIRNIALELGLTNGSITHDALEKIKEAMAAAKKISKLKFKSIKSERYEVLPGGVAVLSAIFKEFHIHEMDVSESALREGLMYDMFGRTEQNDVRQQSIKALVSRYHVDEEHAQRVKHTAHTILDQVAKHWDLEDPFAEDLTDWASMVHEIGLTISLSGYHKHGAYIIENTDLPGFSTFDQKLLALLVRAHRRKFPNNLFKALDSVDNEAMSKIAIIIRIAVILHRSRSSNPLPSFHSIARENILEIEFPDGWLEQHPLTQADLEQEISYLKNSGFKLMFR